MLKKLLLPLIVSIFGISIINVAPTYAENTGWHNGGCNDFLGLISWDCGVPTNEELSGGQDNDDKLSLVVWGIAANVAYDISVVAAYLILAYIIYGGYLYIFSGGDTGKVATGKKALNQAFIGMAITLSANVILGVIRSILMQNNSFNCTLDSSSGATCNNAALAVSQTIQWFIGICGAVAAVFVVGGGIMYMTSSGDPGKTKKAKDMIIYALIGLVIVALAQIISSFIVSSIKSSQPTQTQEQTNYINSSKEYHEIKETI